MTHQYVSREELYERVWSTPLRQLAPEYGMSDRGLGKVCTRLEIPLPGVGYWRKVELGHKVEKESLPKASDTCERHFSFWVEGIEHRETAKKARENPFILQVQEWENRPENKIIVPDTIRKLHPLAKRTLDALRDGPTDSYGRAYPQGEDLIDIICSKKVAPRATRFLHVLITELEKRRHTLTTKRYYYKASQKWSDEVFTYIVYAGEDIQISLLEKTSRITKPPSKDKYSWGPQYEYIATGELALKVESLYYYYAKHNWSDTKNKTLEDQLNNIMIDLAKISIYVRLKREKEEQKECEEEKRRQEQELLRLKKLQEEKRVEYLEGLLAQWLKAKRIREFLSLAEKLPLKPHDVGMDKDEWLEWARAYANRLDPLFPPVSQEKNL